MLMRAATGRKEITFFFYIFMGLTFASLILDSGVVPPGNGSYPYFAAVQNGLASALSICLVVNGFVGFQLYEDGTTLSVWLMRCISFVFFLITFLVSLATFKSWAGLGPTHTVGMFVVLYLVSGIAILVYGVSQVILVVNTLQDRWPLGDLFFGALFLIIGQVILYVFSNRICEAVSHYLDGLFFATICNLLAVMMVYKVCPRLAPSDDELFWPRRLIQAVLGFHHPGRPRVLGRHEAEQLGGEGAVAGRGPPSDLLPGRLVQQHHVQPSPACAQLELWRLSILNTLPLIGSERNGLEMY